MAISPTEGVLPPDDVIDLEPTIPVAPLELSTTSVSGPHQSGPAVAIVEGSLVSLSGETDVLRRRRLFASAVFLAAVYGLLTVWVYASDNPATLSANGDRFSLRVVLLGLRCLLAAGVAGVLASEVPLSRRLLRVVEVVLFLGLTLLVVAAQYYVGLDLTQRGDIGVPMILAFVKDGVIQMLVLMMIYGTLIPNSPTIAVRVLVLMFLGPIIGLLLLRLHPQAAAIIEQLHRAEEAGSNILFLAVGMALAVYGSFLVNGLRTQLHEARKFGQYQLVWKLGEGGMGEVYLAEHQLLKRPCALKLIKREAGSDPIALARFEREVQSAARLSHPNTIEIYDYGHTDDGTFYYVMEYLQGLSLSELVRQHGPLPPGRLIYLFRQVCAGLAEAHAQGLVHRDLKPANVFVAVRGGEFDVAKVLDFGLVKLTRDPQAATLTGDMVVSGTPMYMAPEQATGARPLDARADIYALGAVMYYALVGQPPFTAETPFAVMMAHARDPVVPPSQVRAGVPADLERVILCCLAKKPEERYPDAKSMAKALAACAAAAEWDAEQADLWWAERMKSAPVEAPPQPVGRDMREVWSRNG
jgi:eukaryotic-like serine/threonine-protein kinase